MQEMLQTLLNFALSAGIKLVISGILLIVGFKLIKMLAKFLEGSRLFGKIDPGVHTFIKSFVSIALKILLILTVAAYLGLPMTNMIAVLGSAGLALGLALQGSLSNLAGGLMILIFKPFGVGDFIESGSDAGTVESISILYTELRTPDNCRIVIPNGTISNAVVKDYSVEETRRVDLEFSVGYRSDIDQVKKLLSDLANAHELVLKDPAPAVYLKQHGDSALVFSFRVWTKNSDYWTVYFDMNECVKKAFDAYGIEIPFPQLDVHLNK